MDRDESIAVIAGDVNEVGGSVKATGRLAEVRPTRITILAMISRRLFGVLLCVVAACGDDPSRGHIRHIVSGTRSVGQRDGTFRRFETVELVLPKGFVITDPGSARVIDPSGRPIRPTTTSLQSGREQTFSATFEVPEHFHMNTLHVDSFVVDLQNSLITRAAP